VNTPRDNPGCSAPGCCGPSRRQFLQAVGIGGAALALGLPAAADAPNADDFERLIPADKKLPAEWLKSLTERGTPAVYSGKELDFIGMPVGGICAGQLYLGGDGRLWHWDLFNRHQDTGYDGHNYVKPPKPASPLHQGFALRVTAGGKTRIRALDRTGFADVRFHGQYPVGTVEYRDDALPVAVTLEAFSPFIPLDADDSGLPATVMQFRLRNTGKEKVEAELAGWLENAVGLYSAADFQGVRRNRTARDGGVTLLECRAEAAKADDTEKPPTVFADFEGADYGDWKVEGEAFGKGPATGPFDVQGGRLGGFLGKGYVNSYRGNDDLQGKLTSPEFTIERNYVSFLVGGGSHAGQTCVNLVVDGKVVRTATGKDTERLEWANWDVRGLHGKKARVEIVDQKTGPWGHILVDQIEFRDTARTPGVLEEQGDFGTLALAVLDGKENDRAVAALPEGDVPLGVFAEGTEDADVEAKKSLGDRFRGALSRRLMLEPGKDATVTFVLAWHFPNLRLPGFEGVVGRHYGARFADAAAVVGYVAKHFDRLSKQTRLWRDTWYDSTLPYWFLDRTFANTSTLATGTCFRLKNGRFYGWEGVGCCAGTCDHVWHYAHAVARLFPELERSAREQQDYGIGFDAKTGLIDHRGEFHAGYATDGQAGTILRAYREHQMAADDAFLKRLWPKVKLSLEYLIGHDGNDDGLIEDHQHNTLDTGFWGPSSWLSSLYLAALRAGEAMAREMGDEAFAKKAGQIADSAAKKIVAELWNGEYFIHKPDPKHPEAMRSGNGCLLDQVFGQGWAFQVGLGRILDEEHVKDALRSVWKYNFAPDVGPHRAANKAGRWYAVAGEAGLILCTWPKGPETQTTKVNPTFVGYFNECMNGFEYQVAGHMVWEGLVQEGLAATRAVHDRYHPAKRNVYNEIECGDHYARSMASYGVFLAACGYEYHGPKGHLAFAPRLSADDFRAPFTAAEGWGTFTQKREGNTQKQTVTVRLGRLRLKTLAFELPADRKAASVRVRVANKAVDAAFTQEGRRVTVTLPADTAVQEGQGIDVEIGG
jgi:uncharacterized protein (DUF608 family)